MELLTTKIIALALLGTLSLFFGLLPLKMRKYLTQGRKKSERIISCCLCFGGGVLLATVFIHMIREVREGFQTAFALKYITAGADYPLAELVICAGFFMIYAIEELVRKLTQITGVDDSKSSSHQHHHHHHHHHHHRRHGHHHISYKMEAMETEKPPQRKSGRCSVYSITEAVKKASVGNPPESLSPKTKWAESGVDNPGFASEADATSWNPAPKDAIVTSSQVVPSGDQEAPLPSEATNGVTPSPVGHSHSIGHSHSNGNAHSGSVDNGHGHSHMDITKLCSKGIAANLRSVIIVLALSIHSVFEGLAVGLQERVSDVWYLFGAISAHKLVIAFCLGFKLMTSMPMGLMVIYMVVFALVSPLGVAVGILVTEGSSGGDAGLHLVVVTVLQGLAAGTILYVTFFEILEQERAKSGGRLWKLLFVFLGFALMATVEAVGGHSHGPQGGHCHSHGVHGHSHGGHAGHVGHVGHNHEHDDIVKATTTFAHCDDHNDDDHDHSEDDLSLQNGQNPNNAHGHSGHIHAGHGRADDDQIPDPQSQDHTGHTHNHDSSTHPIGLQGVDVDDQRGLNANTNDSTAHDHSGNDHSDNIHSEDDHSNHLHDHSEHMQSGNDAVAPALTPIVPQDPNRVLNQEKGHSHDHTDHSHDHADHSHDHADRSPDLADHSNDHADHSHDHADHNHDHSDHSHDHAGHSHDHEGHSH